MQVLSDSVPVPDTAQHDPQCPWSLTGCIQLDHLFLESNEDGSEESFITYSLFNLGGDNISPKYLLANSSFDKYLNFS